jgi:hypothetical protein
MSDLRKAPKYYFWENSIINIETRPIKQTKGRAMMRPATTYFL